MAISYRNLLSAWDNFFFEETPTIKEGFFRIVWGLILLCYVSQDFVNINDFYSKKSIISLTSVLQEFNYPHINVFQYFGKIDSFENYLYVILILAIFSFIIGLKTRFSLVLILISMVSFHQRNIWLLSSSEVLLRTISIYLLFSNCHKSLSLDAYLHNKKSKEAIPEVSSSWIMKLIQIQLSVVYVWTVWQKLKGDTWFDGTALYYATRLDQFKNFPVPFLFDSIFILKILTWGTLILEFLLGTLIWIKEFRIPLIISGIIFHLFIEYSMSIPFFEYIMIALLLTHFTGEEFQTFVYKLVQKFRGSKPTES
jgi:hypothetical protein